jgi:hypothetical protein
MGAVAASAQRGLHLPASLISSLRVDNQTPALFFNRKKKKKKKKRTQNREKAG